MAQKPESNYTTDGIIVTIDGEVVWDGEGDQLGLPSLVGNKSATIRPAISMQAEGAIMLEIGP
jgi:hypothetical protein